MEKSVWKVIFVTHGWLYYEMEYYVYTCYLSDIMGIRLKMVLWYFVVLFVAFTFTFFVWDGLVLSLYVSLFIFISGGFEDRLSDKSEHRHIAESIRFSERFVWYNGCK